MLKKLFDNIKKIFIYIIKKIKEVSTVPRKKSYHWRDDRISVLAGIILWFVFICRALSLLQWVKLIYRKISEALNSGTKDIGSKRVNVPPAVVEAYYVFWFGLNILFYKFNLICGVTKALSYYFIFESTVWVIYYTIFRRFYEENYKINHVLEYFVVLLILIPSQALAFSNLYSFPFKQSFLGLLNIETISDRFYMNLMGLGYQVIVIAMIISTFPSESVYVKQDIFENIIIGCGDVVKNRLFLALDHRQDIITHIYSIPEEVKDTSENEKTEKSDAEEKCEYLKQEEIEFALKKHNNEKNIFWISTPSNFHYKYLDLLIKENVKKKLIVLEKPIAVNKDELDKTASLLEQNEKIFCLSYYILEKALPLYFYYLIKSDQPNRKYYTKYLDYKDIDKWTDKEDEAETEVETETETEVETDTVKKNDEEKENEKKLFPEEWELEKIIVKIIEDEEKRESINDFNGGQVCETFIHNMLIASLFVGLPENWKKIDKNNWQKEKNKVILEAEYNGTKIKLHQEKKAECNDAEKDSHKKKDKNSKRYAILFYKHKDGKRKSLIMNFDDEVLYICDAKIGDSEKKNININKYIKENNGKKIIWVKKKFNKKYYVLTDLVSRAASGECSCDELDGRKNQIECLKWLLEQKPEQKNEQKPEKNSEQKIDPEQNPKKKPKKKK